GDGGVCHVTDLTSDSATGTDTCGASLRRCLIRRRLAAQYEALVREGDEDQRHRQAGQRGDAVDFLKFFMAAMSLSRCAKASGSSRKERNIGPPGAPSRRLSVVFRQVFTDRPPAPVLSQRGGLNPRGLAATGS